jgi:hypothetical protein
LSTDLEDAEHDRDPRGRLGGVPPSSMENLGGGHIAESETAGDVGQRTALDRRLP